MDKPTVTTALTLASVFLAAASVFLVAPGAAQAKPSPQKLKAPVTAPVTAPQQATLSWLALTDSGKNAQAWEAASPTFQSQVTQSQWAEAAQSVRNPLGKVQKRTLQSGQRTATLPGVPPGDYAVLTYATVFEKKNAAIETVILTHNTDGKWRVSGYFIK